MSKAHSGRFCGMVAAAEIVAQRRLLKYLLLTLL